MNQASVSAFVAKNKVSLWAAFAAILLIAVGSFAYFGREDASRIDTSESSCFGKTIQAYDFNVEKQECLPMDVSACAASRFETSKEACLKKNGIAASTGASEKPVKKRK